MTARLPTVAGDDNNWGGILNTFLQVAHNADGTLAPVTGLKVVHVSPNGNDSNNGLSPYAPVKTLVHALAVIGTGTLGVVMMWDGQIDAGAGVSLAGYSCSLIGVGDATKVTATTTQTGPVLDFTGYIWPISGGGENTYYRRPFRDFQVIGDGIADATNTHKGIKLGVGGSGATIPTGATFTNITVSATGGSCFDAGSAEWCQFDIVCNTPVSSNANSIPYFVATGGFNGNEVRILCRSISSVADTAVGGAVQLLDDGVSIMPEGNSLRIRTEFLHLPSNGCMLFLSGVRNTIDFDDFDSVKVAAATGTQYIILKQPGWAGATAGGNIIVGSVPGKGTNANSIDAGVSVQQPNNAITGTKIFKGTNVVLSSGVNNTFALIGGQVSGASDPTYIDNSGTTTNLLLDGSTSANPGKLIASSGLIVPTGGPYSDGDPTPITNQLFATVSRQNVGVNTLTATTSGLVRACITKAYQGQIVGHLQWCSGGTAATTPTHQWLCLTDASGNLLAVTADQGSAAIAANTVYAFPVATIASGASAAYTIPSTGPYYIGLLIVASVMPTMDGLATPNLGAVTGALPVATAISSASFTTPPSFPTAFSFNGSSQYPWFVATT